MEAGLTVRLCKAPWWDSLQDCRWAPRTTAHHEDVVREALPMAGGFNGIGQSPESWSRRAGEPSIEPCPPVGRQGADQSRNDVPLLPEAPPL